MIDTVTPVQGRWGWYALDYPTFAKVKEFHRLLLRDLGATKRYGRWSAKLPHNRVRRQKDGQVVPIPEPACLGTDPGYYRWVLAEYRTLRHPAPDPESVKTPDLPRGWEDHLEKLTEFYRPSE